jgi:hypothetical protein
MVALHSLFGRCAAKFVLLFLTVRIVLPPVIDGSVHRTLCAWTSGMDGVIFIVTLSGSVIVPLILQDAIRHIPSVATNCLLGLATDLRLMGPELLEAAGVPANERRSTTRVVAATIASVLGTLATASFVHWLLSDSWFSALVVHIANHRLGHGVPLGDILFWGFPHVEQVSMSMTIGPDIVVAISGSSAAMTNLSTSTMTDVLFDAAALLHTANGLCPPLGVWPWPRPTEVCNITSTISREDVAAILPTVPLPDVTNTSSDTFNATCNATWTRALDDEQLKSLSPGAGASDSLQEQWHLLLDAPVAMVERRFNLSHGRVLGTVSGIYKTCRYFKKDAPAAFTAVSYIATLSWQTLRTAAFKMTAAVFNIVFPLVTGWMQPRDLRNGASSAIFARDPGRL